MPVAENDITVKCGDGTVIVRVGAIIAKDGKFLMTGNENVDYLYSVGGRIKFGESAEQAVKREVFEETGVKMDIERLGFVHENFFFGDTEANMGRPIYEISFFFYMKVPDDFEPVCMSFNEDSQKEHLMWVSPDTEKKIYPLFFRQYALSPAEGVQHIVTDERK